MKILVVSHGFPPDEMAGAEIYAWKLACALTRRNHEVAVFCPTRRRGRSPDEPIEESVDGVRVFRVFNDFSYLHSLEDTYRNTRIEAAFERLMDEMQPDACHVHHVIGTSAELIPRAARRVPVICTLHDFWFHCARGQRMTPRLHLCDDVELRRCSACIGKKRLRYAFDAARGYLRGDEHHGGIMRRSLGFVPWAVRYARRELGVAPVRRRLDFMTRCLNVADVILAPSRFMLDAHAAMGISTDKLEFSEYGMDAAGISAPGGPRPAPRPDEPVRFGFIGTLIPNKGPETLVRAFQRLDAGVARLDVHGAAAGPNAAAYARRLERLNRHPDLRFHGRFDNRRVGEILAGLHVLVVPSLWYENAPLTLHEAAMAHLPVITSDHGGMAEFAARYGNAVTVPAGDAAALAAAMRRFIDDRELVTRLSLPRRAVRSIDDDAEAMESRLERLVQKRADGAAPTVSDA